jgi:hypothetical protein
LLCGPFKEAHKISQETLIAWRKGNTYGREEKKKASNRSTFTIRTSKAERNKQRPPCFAFS